MTGAARALGYSPSNVTQHVRRLERALGSPLVERVGRRIVLTDRARALVDRGRQVLLQLDDLADATRSVPSGTIDVGAFPTGLRGLLVPAIADLARDLPELAIRPYELEPDEALDRLRSGRLQAAVIKQWGAAQAFPDGLVRTQVLGIDAIDVVLPATHALAGARSLELRELVDQVWALTPHDDPTYRDWFASHQKVHALRPKAIYEASEFASLVSFVEHDLAIAVVPRLGRGPLPPSVTAVPLRGAEAQRAVAIALRQTSEDSPNLTALAGALHRQAGLALALPAPGSRKEAPRRAP